VVEDLVVWVLVGFVVFLAGRRFYRVLKGDTGDCGCSAGQCRPGGIGQENCGVKIMTQTTPSNSGGSAPAKSHGSPRHW